MKILFLDIETVSQTQFFEDLNSDWKEVWTQKHYQLTTKTNSDWSPAESYVQKAAIYAEFGKIIVISCGYFLQKDESIEFRTKTFAGQDERELLSGFSEMLFKHTGNRWEYLCAHNGKEFDFPYLCRRLIVHGIPIPPILNQQGLKPWETKFLDTLDMWRFGDWKNYISLRLLCLVLGIDSPKEDISGSDIHRVYYEEKDLEKIAAYCQRDVFATALAYCKLTGNNKYLNAERTLVD